MRCVRSHALSGVALLLVFYFEETGGHSLAAAFVTIRAILDFPTVFSPLIQIPGKLLIETHQIGAKSFK
ncbi:MAG: hypothetical protein KAI21_03245 [Deltaproteobacteria bacterium]|nr:hypothetical protein [Deltaproteobacteria bacterium]